MESMKWIATGLLLVELCGCTVMELRNEVKTDEARLAGKEGELKIEEARQIQLQQDVVRLQSDLAATQMSLHDLKSRLAELERANAAIIAETKAQQEEKRKRAANLQKHQKEVAAIEQSSATVEEKQKRLQFLKDEIRKSLSVLLHT